MIELVFTACLLTAPDRCDNKHLTYFENITPAACMMHSQVELAKWTALHPNWQIKRWKCQYVDTTARDV